MRGFLDLSPRFGVAYDLRGDGKTSVKGSLGRYLAAVNADGIYASTAPVALIGGGGARTAPSWYRRPYDWGLGLSVQHELRPRLSVEISYNRRWWGNRSIVDNLLVGPADFNAYSVQAPVDPRLPGGGGYVIGDLQDVSVAKFGAISNFEVFTSNFGNDVRYFHAADVNLRGQLRGVTLRASTTTGRQVTDTCELIFDSPSLRNCHVALPFQTTFSGLAAYTIPKVDVQVSAVIRSSPGSQISANLVYSSSQIAQTLGRQLSGGAANMTINLLDPGQQYRDRINLADLRFAKVIRLGRRRLNVGVDIFNALNSNVVLNSNNTYGNAWLTPTAVQVARQMQFEREIRFLEHIEALIVAG